MTTTSPGPASTRRIEPKPEAPTPADRGAALLANHVEATRAWGLSSQATLSLVLADLIAVAEEDPDLSFADALAEAWRRHA